MKRTTQDIKRPYCGSDYQLVRAGRRGTYWQAPDGRCVQLAAADCDPVVERSRVSVVAVLVALAASGAARR
jgi:biotin-(acetyl-CoA carboxylase) ligase